MPASITARRRRLFFLSVLIIPLVIFWAWPRLTSDPGSSQKLQVMTTILPLQEFARAVCGEKGQVKLLIPPGVDIHSWSPRPSDIHRLARADCLVYIGRDLEPWVEGVTKSLSSSKLRLVEAARVIYNQKELSFPGSSFSHQKDPHLWLDLEIDCRIIDLLVAVFSELRPQEASFFQKNGEIYKAELENLDKLYQATLKNCRLRTFVVGGHAAYGWLARRYGLTQLALTGVNPDAQPSSRSFMKVIERMKKEKITVVFVEPFSSERMARALARETRAEVVTLNPGVFLPPEKKDKPGVFLSIMKENLEKLKYALGCH
mgnify:CR=1 FL=1|jgi:zinc transport system substrate-binding protein